MAELAKLADIQQTVHPDEVTRQLHVMAQARESSPVIERRSNQLYYATNWFKSKVYVDLYSASTRKHL